MPRIKKPSSPGRGKKELISKVEENREEQNKEIPSRLSFFSPRNIILAILLILIVLGWKFKGYFITATVNGQPVSRWELNEQLMSRFGQQTLDTIVNERLILGAARQKGVLVTTNEINDRIKQIEEKLKGKSTLAEALAAQGMTEGMFRRQIEIQVSIEKLFAKEATVSSQEIDDYISKNGALYKNATDQAAVKEEVKTLLSQQKLSEAFDSWFTDIKKNAKVLKFL